MRAFMIASLIALVPLSARAHPDWCSVSQTEAAVHLAPVTSHLASQLDQVPKPLAHVHTEGTLPHQGIRDESIEAERQLPLMRDAAYAWRAV